MDPELIQFMTKMYQAFKHDPQAQAGEPVPGLYANGGLFSYPYARPSMYSANIMPQSFIDALPMMESRIQNEVVAILTGVTEAQGDNPDNVCGDPPTPGDLKACNRINRFGTFFMGSKVVDVTQVGLMDSWAAQPRQIENWATQGSPIVPEPLRLAGVNFMSDNARRLYELGTGFRRALARVEVDGNNALAPNLSERGWIREFNGLSRLVVDGIVNVDTGEPCPAADSLVIEWNDAVDATVDGLTLPQAMADAYFAKSELARQVGMDGTRFAFVMDARLFRSVTFIFACTYAFARCGDATDGTPIGPQMAEVERRFNEQFNGRYLLIGGEQVPVFFTSGAEVESGEGLSSSIFLVPLEWNGRPLTYLHYFPLNNTYVQEFDRLSNTTGRTYTNNGLFAFATRSNGFCDQLLLVSKMRLMLDTPFLAARIDGITFDSYIGRRSWDPNDEDYVNGGVTEWQSGLNTLGDEEVVENGD